MLSVRKLCVIGLSTLVFAACGESDDSSSDNPEDVEDAGNGQLQLVMAEATPSESLQFADQTMASVDQALEATAGSLVLELTSDDSGGSDGPDDQGNTNNDPAVHGSKFCSVNGNPMHEASSDFTSLAPDFPDNPADDGTMSGTHENYGARLFHCKLKINSESPDTPRGAYSLVKGILCAVEKANIIDWDNPGTTDGASIEFTDDCFGPKFIAEMKEMGGTTLNLSVEAKLVEDGSWDRSVKLSNLALGDQVMEGTFYQFAFKNSDKGLGIKFYGVEGEKPAEISGWTFSIDTVGAMRFERKSYVDPTLAGNDYDGEISNDFLRILAKGKVEAQKDDAGEIVGTEFSSIDSFEGIFIRASDHPDAELAGKTSGEMATIRGTSEAGFETKSYACNNAGFGAQDKDAEECDPMNASTWTDVSVFNKNRNKRTCFPRTKDCEGVEPLEFKAGDEAVIMRVEKSADLEKDPHAWIKDMGNPLSFDAVTWDFIQE